jgi:hypothetical protein
MNEGKGDYDHAAIVTATERLAGVEIAKPRSGEAAWMGMAAD